MSEVNMKHRKIHVELAASSKATMPVGLKNLAKSHLGPQAPPTLRLVQGLGKIKVGCFSPELLALATARQTLETFGTLLNATQEISGNCIDYESRRPHHSAREATGEGRSGPSAS